MTIITPLPDPPQTSDPANFDSEADTFIAALPTFVAQANTLESAVLAAAAPGGIIITYTFDGASAAVADPGNGKLRLNNLTQGSATAVLADNLDNLGVSATPRLARITSTSTIKATVALMKAGDPTKWLIGNAMSFTSPSGYTNVVIQDVITSGANPFTDGDALVMTIIPTGSQGTPGPAPYQSAGSAQTISGSPSTVTFTGLPTGFGELEFIFNSLVLSTSADLRGAFSNDGVTFSSPVTLHGAAGVTAYAGRMTIQDYGNALSFVSTRLLNGSTPSSPGAVSTGGIIGDHMVNVTGGITAVRFSLTAGTFSSGTITPRCR